MKDPPRRLLIAAGETPTSSPSVSATLPSGPYGVCGHLFEGRYRGAADAIEAARAESLANSSRTDPLRSVH